jgi:hypothetical protein
MSPAQAVLHSGTIKAADLAEVQELLRRSAAPGEQDVDAREVAALWYQLSEKLCRRGVPFDELISKIEQFTDPSFSARYSGEGDWSTLRVLIRYYAIRGYQDAIK